MSTNSKVYGGYRGPDATYLKLVSCDGHEFIVKKELALASGTIKTMLAGAERFSEEEANVCYFDKIPSHVLRKVCSYFFYKKEYETSGIDIQEFKMEASILPELVAASEFLDV